MHWFGWLLIGLFVLLILLFILIYVCFRLTFYVKKQNKIPKDKYEIPPGRIYEPYREQMVTWMKEVDALPHREFSVTSFDGLRLYGKYYECAAGAPIELMFHGYRGSAMRDLCGGVQRCFALGHNVLIVDQRAGGKSDGQIISFGINESKDCMSWLELITTEFGSETLVILTGISMGAATVMMAADKELPENVVGILADCGYTSPKEIIQKVMVDLHLPPKVMYPFVWLGARLLGGFDLHETTAMQGVVNSKVPILFAHGDDDRFVPYSMSVRLHEACASPKLLLTASGAGHGLAYLKDPDTYLQTVKKFDRLCGIPRE